MINITRYLRHSYIVIALAVCWAWADDADTLAASADTLAADTAAAADAVIGPEPAPPAAPVSYTGAWLSAVIPGAGQFYHKNYIMGACFLTAEAVTGIVAFNRRENWLELRNESRGLRDTGWSNEAYRDSMAGLFSVWADRMDYESRQTKNTAYSTLAWAVGIHYYGFMDALERGGVTASGKKKSPTVAGLLAAVPILGLGQFYNGRPSKAGMITMAQAGLLTTAINHHTLMDKAYGKYDEMRDSSSAQFAYRSEHLAYWKGRYDQAFSRRNTYLWISLFTYIYTIFDAVVDAHLSDYDEHIKVGPDLTVGADGTGVSFQLNFKL